jgi:hypothetical protein
VDELSFVDLMSGLCHNAFHQCFLQLQHNKNQQQKEAIGLAAEIALAAERQVKAQVGFLALCVMLPQQC